MSTNGLVVTSINLYVYVCMYMYIHTHFVCMCVCVYRESVWIFLAHFAISCILKMDALILSKFFGF